MATTPYKLPPGPKVPGFTRLITKLSPVRLTFDSLKYMTDTAATYGNFYGIYIGDDVKDAAFVISNPDLVYDILVRRADEFHKAELLRRAVGDLLGNGLLTSEGDFWKRQRKLAQPAFHHQRIASYAKTMVAATQSQMAHWRSGETRDVAHDMMALTLDIVMRTLFSVNVREKTERIGELMHIVLQTANDRLNGYDPIWNTIFPAKRQRSAAAMNELFAMMEDLIRARKQSDADNGDLLAMLLAARDEDGKPMSDKQLLDEVMTLFLAGHETTANALAWSVCLLAQHPQVEEKLMREIAGLNGRTPALEDLPNMPYSEMVVKESMRLYPPAGGATRQPLHDIELGGYTLPKGANIAISTYTMHRDGSLFPDPLAFKPERFSPENEASIPKYAYLPFSTGPRVCIGNTFSMMESRLALVTMLQTFSFALAPNQTVQAEQLFTIRPKGGLRMMLRSRH